MKATVPAPLPANVPAQVWLIPARLSDAPLLTLNEPPSIEPGARPPNSQERSSRS